jgi:hypothetical protein
MVVLYFNTAMVAGSVHQEIEKLDEDFAKKLLGLQDSGAVHIGRHGGCPSWFIYGKSPTKCGMFTISSWWFGTWIL